MINLIAFLKSFSTIQIAMSSAKIEISQFLTSDRTSSIYKINNKVLRTDPWGTPHSKFIKFDEQSFNFTRPFLLAR